jgi:hypothetical protein
MNIIESTHNATVLYILFEYSHWSINEPNIWTKIIILVYQKLYILGLTFTKDNVNQSLRLHMFQEL